MFSMHYKIFLCSNGITNIFYCKLCELYVGCIVVTQGLKDGSQRA
jgi:hypothetical protein